MIFLHQVWNHFDADSCPGQATGVKVRLDNGVFGFIPTKFISDKHVTNPEERVKVITAHFSMQKANSRFINIRNICYHAFQIGMTLHCRIMKIDIDRFQVDLTCKSSDLADKNNEWRYALHELL